MIKIYEELADNFAAEGVDTQFGLLGGANMYFATALALRHKVLTINVRHEHAAVAAAIGYHSATGKVGLATVTHGPGFTQTMTALTTAAKGRIPMVVFAGEISLGEKWNRQAVDQPALAAPTGAHYVALHSAERVHDRVREAFYIARTERRPVVLGVPYDLHKEEMPQGKLYRPSSDVLPALPPLPPDGHQIGDIAARLNGASCAVLVAGRGALAAGAAAAIRKLADKTGALLATTLPVRGLFDDHPFSLGVCGGFAREVAIEAFARADLVVAFGASLSYDTLGGGKLFPRAKVVQIDLEPAGYRQGLQISNIEVRADARLAAQALLEAVSERKAAGVRTEALARDIRERPADSASFDLEPGTLDARAAFREFERVIPKDYDVVSGDGHQSHFHAPMRGYDPARYHIIRNFGAIGNALSITMGVAAARRNGRVVLFDGDGGLMMHIQELDTLRRHGLKALIVCANDGAFGAELHKLRHEGVPSDYVQFGRVDLESIAKGFGLLGATITSVEQIAPLMQIYEQSDRAMVWNMPISDTVISPLYRRRW